MFNKPAELIVCPTCQSVYGLEANGMCEDTQRDFAMAEAADDLLAACKAAVDFIESIDDVFMPDIGNAEALYAKLNAVIEEAARQ